ncbi:MAG TPA: acetolactate synthase large subunit [Actinomycetota bacterium]|nr:acetolactate synthase large subunit [Actinomycetota bacterium]
MEFKAGDQVTGAQALIRSLELEGVRHVFGIPGGTILPAYDPLLDSSIRHILCRHEQGAAHAADGYAQVTGVPGVCFATSGPGATNLVTGLASAWMDSVPIVAITGQVSRGVLGGDAFQEADVTGITMPITKHSWLVKDPKDIPQVIKEAFHIAATGRPGPVLVDIPKDVLQEEFGWWYPDAIDLPGYRPPTTGDPELVRRAAEAIAQAREPILYTGGGIVRGFAAEKLRELAELTRIPAVTTLMGRGALPDDHELCLGMPGMHGNYTAVRSMQETDLLIALGVRFDDRVTGALSSFAPNAKVIHVDIDPSEIGKNRQADVGIAGHVKHVIPQLTAELRRLYAERGAPDLSGWRAKLRDWQERFPLRYPDTSANGQLVPEYVIERIGKLTNGDAIYSSGVGQHQMWASQYIRFKRPNTWINSGGVGAMGYAVPAGMGAKVARPDSDVWVIDGDGCFQMTCQELATMTTERIPVKIAIMNNAYLGMVRQWQELFYDGRFSQIHLTQDVPDYVKLAEAYGAIGFRCDDPSEVDPIIEKAQSIDDRTVVIDFRCDPGEKVFPMVPAGQSNDDIIMGPLFDEEA